MANFQYLKNIIYFGGSVVIFFAGMVIYGIILNSGELTLHEEMKNKGLKKLDNVKIIINRSNYFVEVFSDSVSVKKYKAVFGKNASQVKKFKDDYVTPIGRYKICSIDTSSQYHIFLSLNYPNKRDAAEALKNNFISKLEYDNIINSLQLEGCPSKDTKLGANIGIHGTGEYDLIFRNLPFIFNWTNGSIAVSNGNIEEILSVVGIGTEVIITN
ncbi:MAG: L,D-transpeptidase [Ignavibacteria bacterium]|jgi:murein L,D-transpeptidase YafK